MKCQRIKIIKAIIITLICIFIYFTSVKLVDYTCDILEINNIFRTTDLIYINPYVNNKVRQIYETNKLENERILKELESDELAKQRYLFGEWDYETNPEIHLSTYEEEFILLANTAREFDKLAKWTNTKTKYAEPGDVRKITKYLDEFKEKSLERNQDNKENINYYLDILMESSQIAIKSKSKKNYISMTFIIGDFAYNYDAIVNGLNVDENLFRID